MSVKMVKPVLLGTGWWVLLPSLAWMGPFPSKSAAEAARDKM